MRKSNLNFNPATIHQFGVIDGDIHPSRAPVSLGPDAKKPSASHHHRYQSSTAATAKTANNNAALVEENNAGLEELMDECQQFMRRIDEDKMGRRGEAGNADCIGIGGIANNDIGMSSDGGEDGDNCENEDDSSEQDHVAIQVNSGRKKRREGNGSGGQAMMGNAMQVDEHSQQRDEEDDALS